MDPMKFLVRKVFFPFWARRDGDGPVVDYLDRFRDLDGWSREAVHDAQTQGIRAILRHARASCPYYADLFARLRLDPEADDVRAELARLPILTKKIIAEHFDGLVSRDVPPEHRTEAVTGGSTGVPMRFLRDRPCLWMRRAQDLYFDAWMGYELGDKMALFVAASHFDRIGDEWKARLRNATSVRMLSFDPGHIDPAYLKRFAREYRSFAPTFVKCFPNALAIFAEYVLENGLELPPARSVSCTGENLYERQREMIRRAIGGELFEKYGTRESGVIACECSLHRSMHEFSPGCLVELVDDDGAPVAPGEIGRILVTDLFNRALPFLRYEIGDRAVAPRERFCACGRPLPLAFDKILGRDRDILTDRAGNPKPGYLFVEVVRNHNLPVQIQVVQPDLDTLEVNIAAPGPEGLPLDRMRADFRELLGGDVDVRFAFVEEIPRDPSGKFRYVVSRVERGTPAPRP